MKKHYDFSNAVRNPHAKRLKKQLTIRIDLETVAYFQKLSEELAMPYQTLMNMYLRDCAEIGRRPHWSVISEATKARKLKTQPVAARRTRRVR